MKWDGVEERFPVLTRNGWKHAMDLKVGDKAFVPGHGERIVTDVLFHGLHEYVRLSVQGWARPFLFAPTQVLTVKSGLVTSSYTTAVELTKGMLVATPTIRDVLCENGSKDFWQLFGQWLGGSALCLSGNKPDEWLRKNHVDGKITDFANPSESWLGQLVKDSFSESGRRVPMTCHLLPEEYKYSLLRGLGCARRFRTKKHVVVRFAGYDYWLAIGYASLAAEIGDGGVKFKGVDGEDEEIFEWRLKTPNEKIVGRYIDNMLWLEVQKCEIVRSYYRQFVEIVFADA